MLARNVMTPRVIAIEPDAAIAQAVRLMLQHRVSGLPVVDAGGKLVGIVSEATFCAAPRSARSGDGRAGSSSSSGPAASRPSTCTRPAAKSAR
jgi:CBS domain-containing protein